jgi:phosphohistidine phosphatase SixA
MRKASGVIWDQPPITSSNVWQQVPGEILLLSLPHNDDWKLTAGGIVQAHAIADYLRRMQIRPTAILHTKTPPAVQTGRLIADHLGGGITPIVEPRLSKSVLSALRKHKNKETVFVIDLPGKIFDALKKLAHGHTSQRPPIGKMARLTTTGRALDKFSSPLP